MPRRTDGEALHPPGLPESLAWWTLYLLSQVLCGLLLVTAIVVYGFGGWPDWATLGSLNERDFSRLSLAVTGGSSLLALFVMIPLVVRRVGTDWRSKLGLDNPRRDHLLIVAGSVLPLAVLSNGLYAAAEAWWQQWSARWPSLAGLGHGSAVDVVQEQVVTTGLPIMLMVAAVGPAIGEEFVFRGLIGRGLLSRWGAWPGILLTTLLFSAAHLAPAHVLATIPVGLFLHLVYLLSGSLWTPILLHFLTNALALCISRFDLAGGMEFSPPLVFSAIAYVLGVLIILRGFETASASAHHHERREVAPALDRESAPRSRWSAALPATAIVNFTVMFVLTTLDVPLFSPPSS